MITSTRILRGAAAGGTITLVGLLGATTLPLGAAATARPHTIRLVAVPTGADHVDNAPHGDSAGDVGIDRFALRRHGHGYGRGEQSCELTDPGRGVAQCAGALLLPHGQVVLGGAVTGAEVTRMPVTGGTGRYRGARGVAVFTPRGRSIAVALRLWSRR